MNEYYQNQDQETIFSWGNLGPSVPVAIKEIRTAFGKCFFLHNKANATLEQKIQGWKIYLHSNRSDKDIIWQVYLGYHGLEYPTFSDLGTHERFLLRPRTETFISFSLTHDTTLPYRGYFQQKKFCSEGDMYETIACIKKCFLDQNNVCNYASTLIDILDILLIYIFIYFNCFSSIAPRLGWTHLTSWMSASAPPPLLMTWTWRPSSQILWIWIFFAIIAYLHALNILIVSK